MDQRRTVAIKALQGVKAIALDGYGRHLDAITKNDGSPVTEIDRRIEDNLRAKLQSYFPDDGFFGEERPPTLSSKSLWIVDPIDGTKAFMTGSPLFGVLLGYLQNGQPILGLALIPVLDQLWSSGPEKKTQCNNQSCSVSDTDDLKHAIVCATSPDTFTANEWSCFNQVTADVRFRCFGGDCYNYLRLASGKVDIVMESGLMPYDYLPLIPIIEGAGGIMTDWRNQPLTFDIKNPLRPSNVLASANRALHDEMLKRVNKWAVNSITQP